MAELVTPGGICRRLLTPLYEAVVISVAPRAMLLRGYERMKEPGGLLQRDSGVALRDAVTVTRRPMLMQWNVVGYVRGSAAECFPLRLILKAPQCGIADKAVEVIPCPSSYIRVCKLRPKFKVPGERVIGQVRTGHKDHAVHHGQFRM